MNVVTIPGDANGPNRKGKANQRNDAVKLKTALTLYGCVFLNVITPWCQFAQRFRGAVPIFMLSRLYLVSMFRFLVVLY
jgi:hypothetical protein